MNNPPGFIEVFIVSLVIVSMIIGCIMLLRMFIRYPDTHARPARQMRRLIRRVGIRPDTVYSYADGDKHSRAAVWSVVDGAGEDARFSYVRATITVDNERLRATAWFDLTGTQFSESSSCLGGIGRSRDRTTIDDMAEVLRQFDLCSWPMATAHLKVSEPPKMRRRVHPRLRVVNGGRKAA